MHCRIAARQLSVFTDFGGLQHFALEHADLGQPFPQPAKLDEPPFSQPDDILLLSRELPPLALAWSFSRARFESWYSDCRSFSVTATRPRPPDEMGCQDGGHLGFGGCARNFCGCRHCFFLLRAGVGASLLLAFKTFHASVLRP